MSSQSRRDFLKQSALLGSGLLLPSVALSSVLPRDQELDYLQGPYLPVRNELSERTAKLIAGRIPQDLKGQFIQTSSNPQFPEIFQKYHWFDGDGMLHSIRFSENVTGQKTASYMNRFVQTDKFLEEKKAGHGLYTGILQLSFETVDNFLTGRNLTQNTANTAMIYFQKRLFSLWWQGGDPYEINPTNLETIGKTLTADIGFGFTAHPKIDPRTGELIYFNHILSRKELKVSIMGNQFTNLKSRTFKLNRHVFFHDMGFTENYIIMFICPVEVRLSTLGEPKFYPDKPIHFLVIDRRDMSSQFYFGRSAFIPHGVNCWEENGKIRIVSARSAYPVTPFSEIARKLGIPKDQIPRNGGTNFYANLHTWEIDLSRPGQYADEHVIDSRTQEFPAINLHQSGFKTRYAYTLTIRPEHVLSLGGILKHDFDHPEKTQSFEHAVSMCCGEPQFVLREGATEEDDGYLLQTIYDNGQQQSEFWIFNAKNITHGPIAKIALPGRISPGAHTYWVPEEQK